MGSGCESRQTQVGDDQGSGLYRPGLLPSSYPDRHRLLIYWTYFGLVINISPSLIYNRRNFKLNPYHHVIKLRQLAMSQSLIKKLSISRLWQTMHGQWLLIRSWKQNSLAFKIKIDENRAEKRHALNEISDQILDRISEMILEEISQVLISYHITRLMLLNKYW